MVKSGVSTTVDHLAAVAAAVDLLAKTRLMVGVPEEEDPRKEGGSIGNAALLYIHDNGAPEANIPARPTLLPGIKNAQPEIERRLVQAGTLALDAKMNAADKAFDAAGIAAQVAVKAKIGSNVPPPLAESTLAARRRRGVTRTNTLVDTAEMQGSVTYVKRKVARK